jgi:hypothetical protein
MLNGNRSLLAMGWYPEKGFIPQRWDHYCEHNILYLLAISSPALAIPADSSYAWSRPPITYEKYQYIYGTARCSSINTRRPGSISETGRNLNRRISIGSGIR